MNIRSITGCLVVLALLSASWGCTDKGDAHSYAFGDGKPRTGSDGELVFPMPWKEYELPDLGEEREPEEVLIKFGGSTDRIRALYGDDPERPKSADSFVIDGGKGWRLFRGYVYLTGYWRYLETDRVRTITWGTDVVARIVPAGSYIQPDGMSTVSLPARDQIFVLKGEVWVFPKDVSVAKSVLVSAGEYIYAHKGAAGDTEIKGPYSIPKMGDSLVEDYAEIIPFLDMVTTRLRP